MVPYLSHKVSESRIIHLIYSKHNVSGKEDASQMLSSQRVCTYALITLAAEYTYITVLNILAETFGAGHS